MGFLKSCALALAINVALSVAYPAAKRQSERREPEMVTYFGERPAFHPNSSSMAFVSKSYGDVYSYDMVTGHITLMTQNPNAGYLRAQYLIDGNLILLGPRVLTDPTETRDRGIEMWLLPEGSIDPIPLNQKVWEGLAISYESNKISWVNSLLQDPEIEEGVTVVFQADVVYNETGYPSLRNKHEVFRAYAPECTAEPQDFRHGDRELIWSCYRVTEESAVSEVRGTDVDTGEVTIYRNVTKEYNEVEGIYPGGEYTTVESAHEAEDTDDNYAIEVYRMKLEPDSQDFTRLTWLSEIPGDKAGNPVVTPDGKYMAFSLGNAADAAGRIGAGYGIYLLELEQL